MKPRKPWGKSAVFGGFVASVIAFISLSSDLLTISTAIIGISPQRAALIPPIIIAGLLGFGCWSLLVIIPSCVKWWKLRTLQAKRRREEVEEEVLVMMEEIRNHHAEQVPMGLSELKKEEQREYILVYEEKLKSMGLAPVQDATSSVWASHMSRMLARVRLQGIKTARKKAALGTQKSKLAKLLSGVFRSKKSS